MPFSSISIRLEIWKLYKIQKEHASYPFWLLMALNHNMTKILINTSKQGSNDTKRKPENKSKPRNKKLGFGRRINGVSDSVNY